LSNLDGKFDVVLEEFKTRFDEIKEDFKALQQDQRTAHQSFGERLASAETNIKNLAEEKRRMR
jgi:hypothetical protein